MLYSSVVKLCEKKAETGDRTYSFIFNKLYLKMSCVHEGV